MAFGTQYQHVGLYAHPLQFLHAMLSGFCLQFPRRLEVWDICEVYAHSILSHLPFHLSYGFEKGCALDVADGTAYFRYHEIIVVLFAEEFHVALDLVGDVRHHLYCLSEIVTTPLLVNHRLVYASGGERVCPCGLNTRESLVVAEVEVCLHAIHGHVTFAVLVWVERTGVDIDVGVELLYGDVVSPCL